MGKGGIGGGVAERLKRTESFDDRTDREAREGTKRTVDALEIIQAPAPLTETRNAENRFALAPGDYGGQVIEVAGTHVSAVAPGVRFTGRVEVKADCVFAGVEFAATTPGAPELIRIRTGAAALFINCTFRRRSTDTATYVTVDAGGRAVFNGAAFFGIPVTGDVIANAAAIADVRVVGTINLTTHAYGAVTVDDNIP